MRPAQRKVLKVFNAEGAETGSKTLEVFKHTNGPGHYISFVSNQHSLMTARLKGEIEDYTSYIPQSRLGYLPSKLFRKKRSTN